MKVRDECGSLVDLEKGDEVSLSNLQKVVLETVREKHDCDLPKKLDEFGNRLQFGKEKMNSYGEARRYIGQKKKQMVDQEG